MRESKIMNLFQYNYDGVDEIDLSEFADEIDPSQSEQVLTNRMLEKLYLEMRSKGGYFWWDRNEGRRGERFVWVTHKGKAYNVEDMATPHIFYSLRMIFNNTVPPVFRVLGPGEEMKRYSDVVRWSEDYKRRAINEFAAELVEREEFDPLESPLKEQFADIQDNAKVILALGI